jgi:hypothetical protein
MKVLLVALLLLAVVVVAAGAYMGAFARIEITEEDRGPFTFVYRDMASGEMNKIGEITTSLNALLESRGVALREPLDVFLPDGRGEIGFAVEDAAPEQLTALTAHSGLKEIPRQRCMVAQFPWRNATSFLVGYFKVDPALSKYRDAHGYKRVEALALNDGNVIVYMQPIVRE